ncbi:MAG: Na+-dependent transporter [Vicinamibacterales bacterium]
MTPFEMIKLGVVASIFLTVLGIGMSATWREVTFLLREPGLLLRSILSMFVVMPVAVAVVAHVSNLPVAVKIALVALAIAPVPPILPRRELKAGGHADYAVGLLAVGALIAIVYVPLAVEVLDRIFGRHGDVSPLAIGKIVLVTILAPLLIGMAIRQWAPSAGAKGAGPVLTIGMILLVAASIPLLMATWEHVVALFGNGTVLIMALVAAGGLLVGHALGGPRPEHRIVLALSTASRHPAVALTVATSGVMQTKQELAAVLLYVVVSVLVSLPYVMWRRRRAAAVPGAP